jgi:hypothetical protein
MQVLSWKTMLGVKIKLHGVKLQTFGAKLTIVGAKRVRVRVKHHQLLGERVIKKEHVP